MSPRKKSKKSRSLILKKYELAYESCIKKALKRSPKQKKSILKKKCIKKSLSPLLKKIQKNKKTINKSRKPTSKSRKKSKSLKKNLTKYQQFVKKYSKDPKIKKLSPISRMKTIAKLWKSNN